MMNFDTHIARDIFSFLMFLMNRSKNKNQRILMKCIANESYLQGLYRKNNMQLK